jgi:predicted TIM-barrel fold metal-dependent hydrolase
MHATTVVRVERDGELALVIVHNPPVNTITAEVRAGLRSVLGQVSGWSPKYFPPQLVQYANTQLKTKMLFGSDHPLNTPDRWMKDFHSDERHGA